MKKDWYVCMSSQDLKMTTNFTEIKSDPLYHPERLLKPHKPEGFYTTRCNVDGWEFELVQDYLGLIQLRKVDGGGYKDQFRIQLTMLLWQSRERPLWSPQQGMSYEGGPDGVQQWVSFGGNDKWKPLTKREVREIFEEHL